MAKKYFVYSSLSFRSEMNFTEYWYHTTSTMHGFSSVIFSESYDKADYMNFAGVKKRKIETNSLTNIKTEPYSSLHTVECI